VAFPQTEAGFLLVEKPGVINMKSLILAGIIVGGLGILDDITVSQTSIVFEMKKANAKLSTLDLYRHGMNVGQDHISSMVNTMVLVYASTALPLLLLFTDNPRPLAELMNYEIIAEEVVRTLVGSIGLILAAPIATALAAIVVGKGWCRRKNWRVVKATAIKNVCTYFFSISLNSSKISSFITPVSILIS